MILSAVRPPADSGKVPFRRDQYAQVSGLSGCYVIVSLDENVLYFGQATNLRRRFEDHLDTDRMRAPTILGAAFWFLWRSEDKLNLNALERGWLEAHIAFEGILPPLNRICGVV